MLPSRSRSLRALCVLCLALAAPSLATGESVGPRVLPAGPGAGPGKPIRNAASPSEAAPAIPAPRVRAAAAIVYNTEDGEVLWESNSQDTRSIASITKVMTAVVFLEELPDLDEVVTVERSDVSRASTTYLRRGLEISKGDLLHLTLIASDNAAARALARVSDRGTEAFIERMNEKAVELGLTSTRYADPSGLDSDNVSSAFDMAKLMTYVSGDERMTSIMQKSSHSIGTGRQAITVRSTNQLVRTGDVDVVAGKTGYIRRAGYCLAALLQLPQGGPQVAVVVLGAQSNATRFADVRRLFDWFETATLSLP